MNFSFELLLLDTTFDLFELNIYQNPVSEAESQTVWIYFPGEWVDVHNRFFFTITNAHTLTNTPSRLAEVIRPRKSTLQKDAPGIALIRDKINDEWSPPPHRHAAAWRQLMP